ncbi:hypothetical protein STCU_10618 [Strigomonas culicis]|uniref:Uncharacterized protein n=1 Tax=Strigomonas culicis TaxID=28005 RepID=S9TH92_9TRYP|nr:hypothetical protein STCU_10618 [Strigomonas culicis]|eukprot:EPY17437.1 hypothetical protein STCU_10618 [Strigomonas culicis]
MLRAHLSRRSTLLRASAAPHLSLLRWGSTAAPTTTGAGKEASLPVVHDRPAGDAGLSEVRADAYGAYAPPRHHAPSFPIAGLKGSSQSNYYMIRSSAGHPDEVAEILTAGRSDPEWKWLKFLCFFCVMSTVGTWTYGVFFPDHIKYFKDEPWSPFRN